MIGRLQSLPSAVKLLSAAYRDKRIFSTGCAGTSVYIVIYPYFSNVMMLDSRTNKNERLLF